MHMVNSEGFKIELYQIKDDFTGYMRLFGVKITHIETGMSESCHETKSTIQNRDIAFEKLIARLIENDIMNHLYSSVED